MEIKKDILWRVYLVFLAMVLFGLIVLGKALYIQTAEGSYWKGLSDEQHLQYREMDADRGTIYSEDGSMLSSSIPFFDVHIDFGAEGLRKKNGKLFREKLDSLTRALAAMFPEKSAKEYRLQLQRAYDKKERYYLLKRNITFRQYQQMRNFPLLRGADRNTSGFIFEDREKRLTPFGLLANRTIGLARSYVDSKGEVINRNVGLELTYDSLLRGVSGKRLVRRISGGGYVPVEGHEIEPVNGMDLTTTLDINMQDIAQQALMKMMIGNESQYGTCIVMEVATGKIKAIVNLGRQKDGSYFEDYNYAITKSEPGSTFKLVTLLSVLEDGYTKLDRMIDLEGGQWKVGNKIVYDSEGHGRKQVTVKQAFELSSNVGMAKLVSAYYHTKPEAFLSHIRALGMDAPTGLGLKGESKPLIPTPKSKHWSAITLPWMSFGYSLSITPLHTLMLYNAVANRGRMMKPYLVQSISKDGNSVHSFEPTVVKESICSESTLQQLRASLEGVVNEGTAASLKHPQYNFAGKTGTALVADGTNGYKDKIYQSSFAGYFPAENPRYSCIVVIRNRATSKMIYGSQVAGPVFREIADKVYAMDVEGQPFYRPARSMDSVFFVWSGWKADFKRIDGLIPFIRTDAAADAKWVTLSNEQWQPAIRPLSISDSLMPMVRGMGLKDALYLLENRKLKVLAKGKGKVRHQSIAAGQKVARGATVVLEMEGS